MAKCEITSARASQRKAMEKKLSAAEIRNWPPYRLADDRLPPLERARQRMVRAGQWAPWQMIGRRMAIGCVALEVTQRCNLDCAYCYLSESSEALKDIPIEEVFRRVDLIHAHYGPNTDVQITGGDPTLRNRRELVEIVRYIRAKGLRPSLFTNGIRASRQLLLELCAAGLEDVAFHVDLSQGREGYDSELALNALRQEYIDRARGLPLSVMFNTTVFPGNFEQVPAIVKFFIAQADVVRLASFQVGADVGRGADRERVSVSADTLTAAISRGAGVALNFGAAGAGHSDCNRYAFGLIVNGRMHDFFRDTAFVQELLDSSAQLEFDRANRQKLARTVAAYLLLHPGQSWQVILRLAALAWKIRRDLASLPLRVGKLSFFVHNFMDSSALDPKRCEACSFMVMTPEGPMSMCVHNARRDDYLLLPARVERGEKVLFFNPVTGQFEDKIPQRLAVSLNRKNARGRAKSGQVDVHGAHAAGSTHP